MEPIWLKSYPKDVPQQISLGPNQSVTEVFLQACERFSDQPAFTNMGRTLRYRELNKMSLHFARFLQSELKLQPGDRIALQMPNLLQYPVALFGALRAGLVVVNTNPLYTPREMSHQFRDSGCKAVVILANFAHYLEAILPETAIEHVIVTEVGDLLPWPKKFLVNAVLRYVKKMVPPYRLPRAHSFSQALARGQSALEFRPVEVSAEQLALLQYTGGTTGVSKGAMLSHRNLTANMEQIAGWIRPRLNQSGEVIITALPLYHIFAFTVNCLGFISLGGHNILITNPRDIPSFIKILKQTKFTAFAGVNTLFNALMNHAEFASVDFSQLKISVAGGMALQRSVHDRWQKLTGTPIIEGYGLTEAAPLVTCNPVNGSDRVGTIGLPVPSTLVKLVDEQENEVSSGLEGELVVRGPQVMMGYWAREEETKAMFTRDGWLKTGDIAVMSEDGFFKIVDRKKDMILVSGFNVYPNEIEDALAQHPKILEVAAVGVPDEHSGEAVKVFVVAREPGLAAQDVIQYARTQLAGYKVPKQVEFRTELPKTNVGKILRRELRQA